jgi:hypothetical protein
MMKRRNNPRLTFKLAALLIVLALAAVLATRSGKAAGPDEPMFRKGEVIVEIRPGANIDDINARIRTTTIQHIYGTYFYRLATPKHKKEAKFRKKLAKDPDVVSAALNPVVESPISVFGRSTVGFPDGHPSTGQSRSQYETQTLFADIAGIHTRSLGTDVVVAVIDTGVDLSHPDLSPHLWKNPNEIPGDGIDNDGNGLIDDYSGWDFVNFTNDPSEASGDPETSVAGHGTFIAGLIALLSPGAKIMPLRAFNPDGVSDAFTVAQAIKYAADNNASVINLSFGSPDDSAIMHDAVNYAAQRGATMIAAVGNEGENTDLSPEFPAGWNQQVIGVAAVDSSDLKADFSNFGSNVSVAAPGVRLFSLFPQFSAAAPYARWSGTSFAAPLTAAEAALILERNPHATNVRQIIESTARNIDNLNPAFRGLLGSGRVDPLQAVKVFDSPPSAHAEITLYPTSIEPAARGKAEIEITSTEQTLEVDGNQLRPRDHYKLLVNGVLIADDIVTPSAVCSDFGGLKIEFSTLPHDSHLPLPPALNPVTLAQHVELRDQSDRVVLQGDFRPATGGVGGGPAGQTYEKETTLLPTAVAPQASGRAKVEIEPQRERLEVEGDGLLSGTSYQIFADGVSLGSANAQSSYFRVEYTSDGSSGQLLPSALSPVSQISHIEIRDPASRVVLQGTLQAGGDDVGGGESQETTFAGSIESLPVGGLIGDWLVGGKTVHVSQATEVKQDKGPAEIGAQVEVRGTTQQDGSLAATRVEVLSSQGGGGGGGEEARFTGVIEALPPTGFIGVWRVAGHTVNVSSSSELRQDKGPAVVGAEVEVRGTNQPDGSVNATRIEVTKALGGG